MICNVSVVINHLLLIVMVGFAFVGCEDEQIIKLTPPKNVDSTTHDYLWKVDTVGKFQSILYDVWGTSSENIYCVGYVDSSSNSSNILHFDGYQWSNVSFLEGYLYGIHGVSSNDIWVVGDNAAHPIAGHYDGTSWKKISFNTINGGLRGVWASASNDVYAVGIRNNGEGFIMHFDGMTWNLQNIPTQQPLWKIWGISKENIFACGYNLATGAGTLLNFNGIKWMTEFERSDRDSIEPRGLVTVAWGVDTNNIYIFSNTKLYKKTQLYWNDVGIPNNNVVIKSIHGSSNNNIFCVGYYGLIIHWNGKSWKRYDQFFGMNNLIILDGIWTNGETVTVVGSTISGQAIIYRGIK